MKKSRLAIVAVMVAALGAGAVYAVACDNAKTTAANASTKAAAGSCGAKGASAVTAQADHCPATGAKASGGECPHPTGKSTSVSAVTAAATPTGRVDAVMTGGAGCGTKATSAQTASASGCGTKSATSAVTASSKSADDCCAAGKGAMNTASKSGKVDAVAIGANCGSHGTAKTSGSMAHGCESCTDMVACDGEVRSAGATVQVVPLKNGVIYVYTSNQPGKAQAIQAAMAERNKRMDAMMAAGDKSALCGTCKEFRGAEKSGKMSREIVNVEGGVITMVTSSDPKMVEKIYAVAGVGNGAAKS